MAEKDPPRVNFVEVKPAADVSDDDMNTFTSEKGNNRNAVEKINGDQKKSNYFPVSPHVKSVHEATFAEKDGLFHEVELAFAKEAKDVLEAKEDNVSDIKEGGKEDLKGHAKCDEFRKDKPNTKKKKLKKNSVLPLNVTNLDKEKFENSSKELNAIEPDCRNDKTKKKSKTKKKKKKKTGHDEPVVEAQTKPAEKEAELKIAATEVKTKDTSGEDKPADEKKKARKLPCCFGFIATWIAKRKQKRRDKKKRAIANRSGKTNIGKFEHKKTRGGEAFVVEIDTNPILKKPLLPPIKQNAGPIRRCTDQRLQTAEERREEELAKRKAAALTYEKKRTKCKARKTEKDIDFRHKTDLNIRFKQSDAERNRYNMSRRTITKVRLVRSIQSSSSCESVSIEGDHRAFIGDVGDPFAFQDDFSDPDAWRVDDVDMFSY